MNCQKPARLFIPDSRTSIHGNFSAINFVREYKQRNGLAGRGGQSKSDAKGMG